MIIISTLEHNNIIVKFNNYNIYLYYYKYKTELIEITFKIQRNDLYLCLYPCTKSNFRYCKFLNIIRNDNISLNDKISINMSIFKQIYCRTDLSLNKNNIYLNFYFIYTIKKYYFHKYICYSFLVDHLKLHKKFNTMNLYKIIALI